MDNNIEKRYLTEGVQIETREDGNESRTISGYAAVFNSLSHNLGFFREKIDPEAFKNTDFGDVVALRNHDNNFILARTSAKTLTLTVDKKGLKYTFEAPNTTAGNDLLEDVRNGNISASSFAFYVDEDKWEKDDEAGEIRTILKIKRLVDVSPVTHPAYPATDVARRSFEQHNKQEPKQISSIYAKKLTLLKLK